MDFQKLGIKKISLLSVICICSYFTIGTLITPILNKENSKLINGHYKDIQKIVLNGRGGGSVSYNLYIFENHDYYKIAAENSKCLSYFSMQGKIKVGQPIQIYLTKPVMFWSIRKPMVVSVLSNNISYMDFDCINDEIDREKIGIPLVCLVFALLIAGLIYKKELNKKYKILASKSRRT